ncbi:CCR4-NOT transcription complex subunit 8 [Bonamia ostreae]|uniref:poly(A)-specific ribonuclease n=1 Tax=Bonamia ostreae TaxID=126728 RepID=A0ABV2AFJ3_9EUKA
MSSEVVDVWSYNLNQEMTNLSQSVELCSFVAINTEYPGIIIRPIQSYQNFNDYRYSVVRNNVNLLKIIEFSLTLFDENGKELEKAANYKFHFKFDPLKDIAAEDSIQFLRNNVKIDFEKHRVNGIDPEKFSEKLIPSGLLLNVDITWICYHGSYDFAFLLKMVLNKELPKTKETFFSYLKTYFNEFYDVKTITSHIEKLSNVPLLALSDAIKKMAKKQNVVPAESEVERDEQNMSRLTGQIFFDLKKSLISPKMQLELWSSIYGLGPDDAKLYYHRRALSRSIGVL